MENLESLPCPEKKELDYMDEDTEDESTPIQDETSTRIKEILQSETDKSKVEEAQPIESQQEKEMPPQQLEKEPVDIKMKKEVADIKVEEPEIQPNGGTANSSPKKKRKRKRVKDEIFTCEFCSLVFFKRYDLRDHLKEQHGDKTYDCTYCTRVLKTKNGLEQHLRVHKDGKLFACEPCNKIYDNRVALKSHLRRHSEKKYKCEYCLKAFTQRSQLEEHNAQHSDDKPYICSVCCKGFPRSTNLIIHMNAHTDSQTQTCHICDRNFTRKRSLQLHLMNTHGIVDEHASAGLLKMRNKVVKFPRSREDYICKECGTPFEFLFQLKKHDRAEHRNFVCEICGKSCASKHSRTSHKNSVHLCSELYECPYCSKTFDRRVGINGLFAHMTTHKQNEYECGLCEKSYTSKLGLKRHMNSFHLGVKPYKCNECSKSFTNISNLERHQRTHTGEKPFFCSRCPKSFARNDELISHLKSHDSLHSCSCCGKQCKSKKSLIMHIKGHIKRGEMLGPLSAYEDSEPPASSQISDDSFSTYNDRKQGTGDSVSKNEMESGLEYSDIILKTETCSDNEIEENNGVMS